MKFIFYNFIICRNRCINKQTNSLHCFHLYAVKDRIDFSGISDDIIFMMPVKSLPFNLLLHSSSEKQSMLQNFTAMIVRVLIEEIQLFKNAFGDIVPKLIAHNLFKRDDNHIRVVSELISLTIMHRFL